MKKTRFSPVVRKTRILEAALPLARSHGYRHLTREQVALAAGISGPALNYHFETMRQFKQALVQYAIEVECLPVVAQALVGGEAELIKDGSLRRRALDSLR